MDSNCILFTYLSSFTRIYQVHWICLSVMVSVVVFSVNLYANYSICINLMCIMAIWVVLLQSVANQEVW